MRKYIPILLMAFVALGLVACTDTSQNKIETIAESSIEEENKNDSEPSEKHVLVAFFSVTGNTKNVAEKIALITDAEIYEIKPAVEYTDEDINYSDSNSRTSKEQNDPSERPQIQGVSISLEEYDTIYIGYPIWWGEEPRIMDTFVESYDFGNITMIPFCTSGSSSIGNSGKNLAQNAGSGKWLEGKRFDANASMNEIKDWIDGSQ